MATMKKRERTPKKESARSLQEKFLSAVMVAIQLSNNDAQKELWDAYEGLLKHDVPAWTRKSPFLLKLLLAIDDGLIPEAERRKTYDTPLELAGMQRPDVKW